MPSLPDRPLEIIIFQGVRVVARCLLKPGRYHIGQDPGNPIMVDEPSISSHHALLTFTSEGEIYLEDLGSSNGTFVEDQAAEASLPVALGARVQLGACRVRLRRKAAYH